MDDRLKTLAMSMWAKISSAPETHPFHQNNKNMHTAMHLLGKQPTRARDLPLEMSLLQTASKASLPVVQRVHIMPRNPITPITSPFVFDIQLPSKAKASLNPQEVRNLREGITGYIVDTYQHHDEFYVDGSVDPETGKSAAAFIYHSGGTKTAQAFCVSDFVSSTQAELAAIHQSLVHIESNPSTQIRFMIHCDSQPAIQSLQHKLRDPLDK
jgi:hypothetical protein